MAERSPDADADMPLTAHGSRLVLASASPRRLDLLRLAGLDPLVRPADVPEHRIGHEPPAAYVNRLAHAKAAAVPTSDGEVVVAADTTVVLDGEPLGKPDDAAHAVTMLRSLSGRTHTVTTGVAVRGIDGVVRDDVVTTTVVFARLDEDAIGNYVATREPFGKAGAYAIQGRAAGFVERIDGSWTNVVGLPLVETLRLLRLAGIDSGVG